VGGRIEQETTRMSSIPRSKIAIAPLALALFLTLVAAPIAAPAATSWSTISFGAETVKIYRDEFGRPHVFAETDAGAFYGNGYIVAQDRLWQLELNRRAARGRLSQIFGSLQLAADRFVLTTGYTDAELDAQFDTLTPYEKSIFEAYRDGINAYIAVVAADPTKKPFEFHALGFTPQPWSNRDSVAFAAFMVRRFGEIGGRELTNLSLLQSLTSSHGPTSGYEIFNDVRWINDPDSPVTVPTTGAFGKPQHPDQPWSDALAADVGSLSTGEAKAKELWERLGVPTKLGSYAWVVSAAKSANGSPMLYGGPQMGFTTPTITYEVQLKSGEGLNVTGMAFPGAPGVLIGRNPHISWTSTTATGDNVDTYAETLCNDGAGYMFDESCVAFETRVESIPVAGGAPVNHAVQRSVHGPVVGAVPGTAFAQKRGHWMQELETGTAFLEFDEARNINEYEAAVEQIVTSHNFLYADKVGNIAYWQAGHVPLRPDGFDARIPLPGTGIAEWPGGSLPIPRSINPARGWLANWNNKPSVDYDNPDDSIFGKQFRLLDIDDRLEGTEKITLEDMRDIPKDIARVKGVGRESRYILPYLQDALGAEPPAHPSAPAAAAVLAAWDGNAFSDAVNSTTLLTGEIIFSAWLDAMRNSVFADELGAKVGESSSNMLLHVLDDAVGDGSGVPPSRDYFNGADPNVVMSQVFDGVLAQLTTTFGSGDPANWVAPRPNTTFSHPLIGTVATMKQSNRATYGQIVVMSKPHATAENAIPLGQSGFIAATPAPVLDPHFLDQMEMFKRFEYKPMPLYLNTQLATG
jgi:penicillin amidase